MNDLMSSKPDEASAVLNETSLPSTTSVPASMRDNSVDTPNTEKDEKLFKRPAKATVSKDFKSSLQYNDFEDHLNQRSHSVGIGLFNTDEIDDLPPRHREKVRKVYQKIVEFAASVLPAENLKTSHGGPVQLLDLLNLEIPAISSRSHSSGSSDKIHCTNQSDIPDEGAQIPECEASIHARKKEALSQDMSYPVDNNEQEVGSIRNGRNSTDSEKSSKIFYDRGKRGLDLKLNNLNMEKSVKTYSSSKCCVQKQSQYVPNNCESRVEKYGNSRTDYEKGSFKEVLGSENDELDQQNKCEKKRSELYDRECNVSDTFNDHTFETNACLEFRKKTNLYEINAFGGRRSHENSPTNFQVEEPNEEKSVKLRFASKNESVDASKEAKQFNCSEPMDSKEYNRNHRNINQQAKSFEMVVSSENYQFIETSQGNSNSTICSNNSFGRNCKMTDRHKLKVETQSHFGCHQKFSKTNRVNSKINNVVNQQHKFSEDVLSSEDDPYVDPIESMHFRQNLYRKHSSDSNSSVTSRNTNRQSLTSCLNFSNRKNPSYPHQSESSKINNCLDIDRKNRYDGNLQDGTCEDVSSESDNFDDNLGSSDLGRKDSSDLSSKTAFRKTNKCRSKPSSEVAGIKKPLSLRFHTNTSLGSDQEIHINNDTNDEFFEELSSESDEPRNNQLLGSNVSEQIFKSSSRFGDMNRKPSLAHGNNLYNSDTCLDNVIRNKSNINLKDESQEEVSSEDDEPRNSKHYKPNFDRTNSPNSNDSMHYISRQNFKSSLEVADRKKESEYARHKKSSDIQDCFDTNQWNHQNILQKEKSIVEQREIEEPGDTKSFCSNLNRNSSDQSHFVHKKTHRSDSLRSKRCLKKEDTTKSFEEYSQHKSNPEYQAQTKLRQRDNSSNENSCRQKCITKSENSDEKQIECDSPFQKVRKFENSKLKVNSSCSSATTSSLNCLSKAISEDKFNIIVGQIGEPKNVTQKYCETVLTDSSIVQHVLSVVQFQQREIENVKIDPEKEIKQWEDRGFFVSVNVSENSSSLEFWGEFFQNALKTQSFTHDFCCKFTESLILNFERKEDALQAVINLKKLKRKTKDLKEPHLICVSKLKTRIVRPCNCEKTIVSSCILYFKDFCKKYCKEHQQKIDDIQGELEGLKYFDDDDSVEHIRNLENALSTLKAMKTIFINQCKFLVEQVESSKSKSSSIQEVRLLKKRFSQECNSFQRGLPIYSEKYNILETVRFHPVSIVIADTGSGKSTQLAEYFLGPRYENGTIICTQPRKIAAISITNYVCGQLGCAVGKLVGYDVGIEKKFNEDTKIIYMTDYALLKKILSNRRLRGVSHVIIDEAHERTLYTDLLLGLLKECVEAVPSLRVIITSATIDPAVFVKFFNLSQNAIIKVPGRTYPVEEIWFDNSVEIGWNYVEACVKTAVKIHQEENKGDVLVFLTSPSEIDESIIMFKEMCSDNHVPTLLSLHGKTDLQEQLLIFDTNSSERKIIFATNAAETSLTIPGVKFVVDCGMAKELMYFPDKNKSCLMVTFINKSSAEQRKGRAGRTQPGVCYRMYSKKNYQDMPDRSTPEILKTNLSKALLKIFEFGIKLESFQFVETPPAESIAKSLDSLEQLGLIKNAELTDLGRKVAKLPIDPQLSKLVLLGVEAKIGFEMAVIAALVSEAGRLFVRFEDNKDEADKKKLKFCLQSGDLCTYLEIYKRFMEVNSEERYQWCVANYINARGLYSAVKTVNEILTCLHQELSIRVFRKYNNKIFRSEFEKIVFSCFSENLCTYSGHPKLGYSSPFLPEGLYLHPSSALSYLKKDFPEFLVYCTLMQTSRNFLMNVTPISKETVDKSCQSGTFHLQSDVLRCLKIAPKTLGPFGESVLVRHILGRGGTNMKKLELAIEMLIKSRNFRIDVCVEKGIIVIYMDRRFHDKVSNYIYETIDEAHSKLTKEEEIVKMSPFSYFCIGAGGKISEIIMPGEYRDIIIENVRKPVVGKVEATLKKFGDLQTLQVTELNKSFCRINATYLRVLDAQCAMHDLAQNKSFSVKSRVYVEESVKSASLFRMRVSWCRSLSTGSGWIEFPSEADRVIASGRLTRNSVCINNHNICFTPSSMDDKELEMSNLPAVVDESMIEETITEYLKDFVEVKRIYIRRRKTSPVSDKGVAVVKKQIISQVSQFTSPSKLVVEVDYPDPRSNVWSAMVYFENRKDGELALRQLENNMIINSFPAEIKEIAESHLIYKKDVYEALQNLIVRQFKKVKGSKLIVESLPDETAVKIKFSCKSNKDLEKLRGSLIRLLMGKTIECYGERKYYYLFTLSGECLLETISEKTQTYISVENTKKSINIYGLDENCNKAEVLIRSQISNKKLSSSGKKAFDLKNVSLPSGFLKCLYEKYGLDLQNLVKEFKLDDVVLDIRKKVLVFYGCKKQLKLVEEHLEEICCSLVEEEKTSNSDSDLDKCAICLSIVPFDYYRLENCGHAFCKSCLLLQVKSSTFPVICVKENCGKDLFLIDIKRILALGSNLVKKSFYNTALQHFVNANIGKITYCPSPGCSMVCRVLENSPEFHCPECDADICTKCQTPYHYGMSCELFQNFVKDEDYSLKIWMQENSSLRKQCPKCMVVIEKESGCNHMECFNCQSHFCWLCLQAFPEGKLVYDHLPYCPKNQGT